MEITAENNSIQKVQGKFWHKTNFCRFSRKELYGRQYALEKKAKEKLNDL